MPKPVTILAYSVHAESGNITVSFTAPSVHPISGDAEEYHGACVLMDGEGLLASPGWTDDDLAAAVAATIAPVTGDIAVSLKPRRIAVVAQLQ